MNIPIDDCDARFDAAEQFLYEFKALVRKYVPDYNAPGAIDMLYMLSDRTSVFSPFIWSDHT